MFIYTFILSLVHSSSEEAVPPLENPEEPDPLDVPSERASPVVTPIGSVLSIQQAPEEDTANNTDKVIK